MLKLLVDYVTSEQYVSSKSLFVKVAGRYHAEKEKLWLLDYDGEDLGYVEPIIATVRKTPPVHGNDKVIAKIPSKSGLHIVTRPFNLVEFNRLFFQKYNQNYSDFISIHKDNPVNLFIP